jgi:hypothetical protein
MANTSLQILRSSVNNAPQSLLDGQLAFSYKSGVLYIGSNTNILTIGGNAIVSFAQSAFNQANTVTANLTNNLVYIQGVNNTQNVRLNSIETVNQDQNTAISIIQGTNATQNVRLNSIETVNQDQNTAISIIQGTNVWQNTEIAAVSNYAHFIGNYANTTAVNLGYVNQYAASSYAQANTNAQNIIFLNQYAKSGYDTANLATANTIYTQGVDATQNTWIASNNALQVGINDTQNTRLNSIETVDVSQNTRMTIIEGVDATQNIRLGSIETVDVAQNNRMTIIEGVDATQNAWITSNVIYFQSVDDTQNNWISSNVAYFQSVDSTQNNWISANQAYFQGVDNSQNTRMSIIEGTNATQNVRLNSIETVNQDQNTAITIIQGVDATQNVQIAGIQGVDLAQNTRITEVNQYAESAYATANSAQTNTIFTQGVDVTQNVRLSSIETINNDQNTRMSIIESVDNTQNTRLNSIETVNVDQNTAIAIIQGTDATQNVRLNSIETINQNQNTTITQVNQFAQSAYDHANTKFASAGGTITGPVVISGNNNLTVTGNLSVLGTTTTVNTNLLEVNDPMILLANGNFYSDTLDIGFAGSYNDGANAHTGLFREHTNKDYYLFQGYIPEISGNNDINISDPSFRTANLNADYVKANVIATTAVIGGVNFANYVSLISGIDATQNTRLNSIETINNDQNTTITQVNQYAASAYQTANQTNQYAQSAYDHANNAYNYANTSISYNDGINATQNTRIGGIEGVDLTQNTRLNAIETINTDQNTAISIIQGVNLGQNATITSVNQYAVSSYNQANTNAGNISIIQGIDNTQNSWISSNVSYIAGVDDTQNTRIQSIETINTDQNTAISIIQGVNLGQNATITSVNQFAQAAYNKANTGAAAVTYLANAVLFANSTGVVSNSSSLSFYSSNNTLVVANISAPTLYTTSGGVVFPDGTVQTTAGGGGGGGGDSGIDQFARNTANSAQANTIVTQGVDVTQNNNIIAINNFAAAAYTQANTANARAFNTVLKSGDTMSGALNIASSATGTNTWDSALGVNGSIASNNNLYLKGTGYFGLANGQVLFPNALIEAIGNSSSYAQIVMQNKNVNVNASADFVATADNGSDSDTFINMGINSSLYNQAGFELTGPNDGYLYVSGNTSTGGGALVLSTTTPKDIVFSLNGQGVNSEIARFQFNTGLVLKNRITFADATTQNTAAAPANYTQSAFNTANNASQTAQAAYNKANTGNPYESNTSFSTTSANQVMDMFSSSVYRTAKYLIQSVSDSDVHSTEILLNHNDINVFIVEYANNYTTPLISVDGVINSGNVVIYVTPFNSDTTVDFIRTTLVSRIPSGPVGDLMLQSGTQDLMIDSGAEDLNT